jgi:hypothetical protein
VDIDVLAQPPEPRHSSFFLHSLKYGSHSRLEAATMGKRTIYVEVPRVRQRFRRWIDRFAGQLDEFIDCSRPAGLGDPGLVLVQTWLGCKVPADREDWPVGNSSRVDIPGGEICIVPSAGLFRIDKA